MLKGDEEAEPSLQTGPSGSGQLRDVQNSFHSLFYLFIYSKFEKPEAAAAAFALEVPELRHHRLVSPNRCRPGMSLMSLHTPNNPSEPRISGSTPRGCRGAPAEPPIPAGGFWGELGRRGEPGHPSPGAAGLCSRAGSSGLCSCFLRSGCVYSQHE